MPIGGAIAGGLGLAGSIGSSLIQSSAAKSASAAQTALGQQALATQMQLGQQGIQTLKDMFEQAKGIAIPTMQTGWSVMGRGNDIISTMAQPALNAGYNVLSQAPGVFGTANDIIRSGQGITGSASDALKALLTPGADMTATLSQLPGFKFAQDWGQKAVQNMGTTMGLGGNTLKAGADYATGVAQQGFGNYVQQLQALLGGGINLTGTGVNALNAGTGVLGAGAGIMGVGSSLAGVGANIYDTGTGMITSPTNALISAASGAGQSAFSNLNQMGANIGGTLTGIGNASAAGTLGSANALAGGITGGTGAATNALFMSALMNKGNLNLGGLFGGTGAGVFGGGAAP